MATIEQLQAQIEALGESDSFTANQRRKALQSQLIAAQNPLPQSVTPESLQTVSDAELLKLSRIAPALVGDPADIDNLKRRREAEAKQAEAQKIMGDLTFVDVMEEMHNRPSMAAEAQALDDVVSKSENSPFWQTVLPSRADMVEAGQVVGTLALGYAGLTAAAGAGAGTTAAGGGLTAEAAGTTAAMTPEAYAAATGAGYGTTGTAASIGLGTEGMLSSPATTMPLEPVPMYNAPIAETAPVAATNLGQYAAPAAAGGMLASSTSPSIAQTAPAAGGLLSNAANTVAPAATNWWESPQAWSTGLNMLGGYVQGEQATQAAQTAANAQIEAAKIAADAAKFRPVGVTSRFGQSQFGYDDKGNLTSAGYNLSPEAKAQQDILMGISGGMLNQYQGAQAATAPMGAAGTQAMMLGQGYLGTSPQAQAAQYMAEQQALLAPSREREMAALQNRLQAQGRGGLAVGGTSSGMMAANPELEAYYNAIRQQDLGLAAQATQGGMDYAKFGAGMVGTGGDLLKSMYGTQAASYAPYQTALGGATTLEGLGQQPMDLGINIGAKGTASSAQAGQLLAQGMTGAANTMQPANAYTPWAGLLSGAAQGINNYNQPQGQSYDPGKFRLVPL